MKMKITMFVAAMMLSTSAMAVSGPDINWLESDNTQNAAPAQGPFKQASSFNLKGTRLSITVPTSSTWKDGETWKCCEDNQTRAAMNFWAEKVPNDDVRTQYGLKEVENDPKRKETLLKSWEKRLRTKELPDIDKFGDFKSTALSVWLGDIGDGIKTLGAEWYIINKYGVTFRVIEFEIWDGGQRDLIQFVVMVENNDRDKDTNHQLVLGMVQSLRFTRTESSQIW